MDNGSSGTLILARAVHFAATVSLAGTLFFLRFIASPAYWKGEADRGSIAIRLVLRWLIWSALLLVLISGAAWLAAVAQDMSELPFRAMLSEGTFWTVLLDTGFGRVWLIRLFLWTTLAAILTASRLGDREPGNIIAAFFAGALLGSLAWAGHAAATPGSLGSLHLVADSLHLIAAGTWVGALIPLALLIASCARRGSSLHAAEETVRRFSTYGAIGVGVLLFTGIVNSLILIEDPIDLVRTNYGRLLSAKIIVFLVMLLLAAANRLVFTPRLAAGDRTASALRSIARNSVIEAALGAIIIVLVSILGILAPVPPE